MARAILVTMGNHHGMNALPGLAKHCEAGHHEDQPAGRFGRMFAHLPANHTPGVLLTEIGKAGGPMDGGAGADQTTTVPVGHVIFGQFIDHDITLDVTTSLDHTVEDGSVPNVRTPTLDLDCVYGEGPEAHRYLIRDDDARLVTGADLPGASLEQRNDLMRSPFGRAIIGDFRNDENRIVSQMQLGMIKFHNATCDALETPQLKGKALYEEARRHVTWHYQWAVVFDFLVAMCGRSVVDDVLANGRKLYCHVHRPYIPVEFSVAAYRFGHSMVPQKIQIQSGAPKRGFFSNQLGRGFTAVPSIDAVVDWNELFDTPAGANFQNAEKFDTKMAKILLALPFVDPSDERSLATRNLLRGNAYRLPSGEQIAQLMIEREVTGISQSVIDPVTERVRDISEAAVAGTGVPPMTGNGSPLWLYLLAEGEIIGRADGIGGHDPGEGLGPVGARIVAEVIIGLLELDDRSFFGADGNWVPDPGLRTIGEILASTNSPDLP